MFEELEKYKSKDHFFFATNEELGKVCNAPKNGVGIYLVYELKNGRINLVYIGCSGKIKQNGTKKVRIGGMCDRIINGKQFGGPRKQTWKLKLTDEKIDALDVYWYETFDKNNTDIPSFVEGLILQRYFEIYGQLPKWNREF
ncbi:hypothetical protein H9I45_08560 [Polaribacter haliotis]|uniref:GIY-YIG domain-containing protein n=1 Tax=Polaribacter haliotis TaxID=1888915 RepID=A0A7L8ABV2_9FLAO|nr:hypothetical protein [Polaribacter haliotis]QOD59424.1 hypothetical protein H9I45_08560 [Polaribacter haliotis]